MSLVNKNNLKSKLADGLTEIGLSQVKSEIGGGGSDVQLNPENEHGIDANGYLEIVKSGDTVYVVPGESYKITFNINMSNSLEYAINFTYSAHELYTYLNYLYTDGILPNPMNISEFVQWFNDLDLSTEMMTIFACFEPMLDSFVNYSKSIWISKYYVDQEDVHTFEHSNSVIYAPSSLTTTFSDGEIEILSQFLSCSSFNLSINNMLNFNN